MRIIISVILIALLAGIAEYMAPWWVVAVIAFAVTLGARLKPGSGFLAGFAGVALLWLVFALVHDGLNDHILSQRMAILFFKKPAYGSFIAVTVFVGGLIGGLSGWSGALFVTKK